MNYRLAWKNLETGDRGTGKILFPSLDAAREAARMMDEAWPEFSHWAERVDDAAPERCRVSV